MLAGWEVWEGREGSTLFPRTHWSHHLLNSNRSSYQTKEKWQVSKSIMLIPSSAERWCRGGITLTAVVWAVVLIRSSHSLLSHLSQPIMSPCLTSLSVFLLSVHQAKPPYPSWRERGVQPIKPTANGVGLFYSNPSTGGVNLFRLTYLLVLSKSYPPLCSVNLSGTSTSVSLYTILPSCLYIL